MANFVGAIENFNPYIQQIPTEAYTKVGMFKEQQYEAGVQKVQETVDHIAGLDIANEGGRQYLRGRIDELTQSLNKYSTVDFSNKNNVTQLVGLAKPLMQDENIINDVINTGVYRKWAKDAGDAYKGGKMELGQYVRESADASTWLNSQSAGSNYTGRKTPNLSTKKQVVDRIVKIKKDGFEKNEYVYDTNYDPLRPYYIKSTNKFYSEADFNNFISEAVLDTKDREMLMNEHWYENQGVPVEALQQADIAMYQGKINANNARIEEMINDPKLYTGDKKIETEAKIRDLRLYNKQLADGKIKFLQELNLADPQSRDVFHRDIAEARFVSSMGILMDEVKKEEFQKNEQWFEDYKAAVEAAKSTKTNATGAKTKTVEERINEVAVVTPVDPNAPKTEVSLNVMQRGWQKKNDEINMAMNGLIGKLQENGVDVNQFIAGWDQVQVGSKAGASMSVPRFKNEEAKNKFYGLVAGLNFAYTKESEDGHTDNKSFTKWIKDNFTGYKDEDPNSKFTFGDKIVSDAMNTMKGVTALLPRLEQIFADKGVTRTLAAIDQSLKNKKDMANAYREAMLKSGSLSADEQKYIRNIPDDELMDNRYFFDKEKETLRFGKGKKPIYSYEQESDGTFSIYQNVLEDPDNKIVLGSHDLPMYSAKNMKTAFGERVVSQKNRLAGGFKSADEAQDAYNDEGQLTLKAGISEKSFKKAEEYVKKTYSYIQENINSTAQNLKEDKPRYEAFVSGIKTFMNSSLLQAGKGDMQINGVGDVTGLTGITDIEVDTFSIQNTEDVFNPNPVVNVTFKATNTKDKDPKTLQYSGSISLKSFLATNPNYREPGYAQYFAPMMYAEKDAYERIKSAVNPLEGSEASYANRGNIEPVYNRIGQQGTSEFAVDDPQGTTASGNSKFGQQVQWESIPIEKDGKQTMVSYQVVSLGQNTTLGNIKNKDGNTYAPGAFYIKMKVPTSNGGSKVIFLKRPTGESYSFNSPSLAHYTLRDLIFNNPDLQMDETDNATGEVNWFTTNPNTIRGIFNSQLSYNGFSKLETVKLKDALGKEIQKQQAKELQFAR
jgi:hypothetical protein